MWLLGRVQLCSASFSSMALDDASNTCLVLVFYGFVKFPRVIIFFADRHKIKNIEVGRKTRRGNSNS